MALLGGLFGRLKKRRKGKRGDGSKGIRFKSTGLQNRFAKFKKKRAEETQY